VLVIPDARSAVGSGSVPTDPSRRLQNGSRLCAMLAHRFAGMTKMR
jgi:hypothetical protein